MKTILIAHNYTENLFAVMSFNLSSNLRFWRRNYLGVFQCRKVEVIVL